MIANCAPTVLPRTHPPATMPRFPAHLLVDPDNTPEDPDAPPSRSASKSQRKREMAELQRLGERLVALTPARLQSLPLSPRLADAIREARRIKSHEARRRQLQLVGKLMRDVDASHIREQLQVWDAGSREHAARFHAIEQWRDALIDRDDALTALVRHYPDIDVTQLRQHIRQARRERDNNTGLTEGQTPQRKHFRELFQQLKEILGDPEQVVAPETDAG